MLIQPPSVIRVPVNGILVSVVGSRTGAALSKIVRCKVFEINLRGIVLVVAARALREALRRNIPAVLGSKLQVVFAFDPADVVDKLVEVLDGKLWGIPIRADIQTAAQVILT